MQPVRWILGAMALGWGMSALQGAGAARGDDPAAVAEVRSGKRHEARASWWGFDPEEATRALQQAIDSKARTVIVENMGTPWIVDEIRLRSDLELVFEPGVVVQAKRGAFKGTGASLFTAVKVKNLTLRGPGATLRMWREDYDNPSQYKKAEWRHVLNLYSCDNVRILGLTLAESGGDGIYLGVNGGAPNTNILIQDVVCDRNYRQGISVISARGLTIERCVLKNTAGTAPMAGIDFEPNHPGEEVADCVLRDCLVENNAGYGYQFYLRPLDATSRPVSVRFERCRSVGNRVGFGVHAAPRLGAQPVKGEIVAVDCEFLSATGEGIMVGPKPIEGPAVRFERCRVVNAAADQPEQAPILLQSGAADTEAVGGVTFDGCVVVDPVDRRPLGYHDASGGQKLLGVSGTLTVEHAGHRQTFPLDQARLDAWFPFQAYRPFPPFPGGDGPFEPLDHTGPRTEWSCNARQRGRAEWLVWAEAGDEVALTVRVQPVGKGEPPASPLSWISPSGEEKKLGEVEGTLDVAFRATETGAQRLVCEPGSATAAIPRSNRPVTMFAPGNRSFHLIGYAGDLFFSVPEGVEAFAARVSGDGPGESVKATLRDPAGTAVEQKDNIAGHQFLVERPAASPAAVWSLRLERPSKGVLEDIHIQLQGVPPLSATSPDALLKPAR